MNNHLNEETLNEYLDGELDDPARAAAEEHLSACNSCRRSLAELQQVAALLGGLPDEALTRSLAPSVLANLPRPRLAPGWKLVLAAQAGLGMGVVLSVLTSLPVHFEPQAWLAQAITQLAGLELPILHSPFTIPFSIPTLNIQATTANFVFLALSTLLLWGVGNAILLRNRSEASS